jgi:hypothetical protein
MDPSGNPLKRVVSHFLIPIWVLNAFLIRPNKVPGDPKEPYPNEHSRLTMITPHTGIEFENDNGRVFDYLKSWTLNGPAWTWICSFNTTRNG